MANTNNTESQETGSSRTEGAAGTATPTSWEREMIDKMLSATVKEQRARRRWGIFFKLTAIILVVTMFFQIPTDFSSSESVPTEPHAALIRITGVIQAESKVSAENVIKALQKAFSEKNTVGIILRISSPGGSPVQAGKIHDEILRLRTLHPDKQLHVVVEEMCTSGGYYIAVAANNIYVDKASVVGSIGVMINGFGFADLIHKVGIERRLITSGKNKGFMDPFSAQNEEHREYAQNLINEVHEQFVDVVKKGRGSRLVDNSDLFTGLMWTGSQAIALGLVDDFGNVESVARNVFKTQTIVDYTEEERLTDRMFRRLGISIGEGIARFGTESILPALR